MKTNIFINDDCLNYMKTLEDKSIDLIFTDPPYGINATNMQMGNAPNRKEKGQYPGITTASRLKKGRLNGGSGKLKNRALNTMNCNWDYEKPSAEYFKEMFRVSKNQIIWGGNYFGLPATRCIICWDKLQPWDNFSQWEMAWTSFDKPAKMYRISNTGGANSETKTHPTQKPVKLFERCLRDFSNENDIILDCFSGSGTTAIASHNLNRQFICIEKDKEYFDESVIRYEKHIIPYRMEFKEA